MEELLARCASPATVPLLPTGIERGETYNMKYLALLALVAGSMMFAACAHHDAPSTTTMSSSHGYKK